MIELNLPNKGTDVIRTGFGWAREETPSLVSLRAFLPQMASQDTHTFKAEQKRNKR